MSDITLSSHGHSCIALTRDGSTLVIDPGAFSDEGAARGADAVLITHEHPDHVVPETLAAALRADDHLHVWAPQSVVAQIVGAGGDGDRVHAATPGESFEAAGMRVEVVGGEHAVIHPDFPPTPNVAYLVAGAVLHPGDSFAAAPDGVRPHVLLAPVAGPWMKLSDAVDFVRRVGAPVTVPIHDAILSDLGIGVVDGMMGHLAGPTTYRRLARGEKLTVPVA